MNKNAAHASSLQVALVSSDTALRDTLRAAIAAEVPPGKLTDFPLALPQIGPADVAKVARAGEHLVVVDVADDPVLGLRFARHLAESVPRAMIAAAGPELAPDLLLEAMRAGVGEYLPKPVGPEEARALLGRVRKRLGLSSAPARKPGTVYTFLSPKGGTGTTTAAVNLAAELRRATGKHTLLVDLNVELGDLALVLGITPRFNFVDLVRNFHRIDAGLLASYVERHESGVHVLAAPLHPEQAGELTADVVRRILQFLREHYDYIVVDTAKSMAPPTLAACDVADQVFLLVTADLSALRNVKRSFPVLKKTGNGTMEHVRLIVNRYHPRDLIAVQDVEETLGLEVYWTLSNDYDAVTASIHDGKPIVLKGDSPYSKDMRGLAAELAGSKDEAARADAVHRQPLDHRGEALAIAHPPLAEAAAHLGGDARDLGGAAGAAHQHVVHTFGGIFRGRARTLRCFVVGVSVHLQQTQRIRVGHANQPTRKRAPYRRPDDDQTRRFASLARRW